MPAEAHRRWALGILLAVLASSCLHNAAAQSVLDQLLGGGALTPTAPLTPTLPGTGTDPTTTTPAAATVYCNMTPTWFPKGYENSAFPPPLWLDNQVAAGYNGSGDPLRVALANYGNPKFYLGVNWFMLQQNKVPAECASSLKGLLCSTPVAATPPTTVVAKESALGRRLLQTSTVLTPVTYEITWTLNDGPKQVLGTYKPGQNRAPPFIELDGYSDLTDGDYCVNARITALARSGSLSVGGKAVDVPCKNITESQIFCFTKVVKRPYTKVKYHSCNKNFTVDFTGIIPAAQYASVATVPPTQLYSVLIHFYGNASRDDIFDNRTADERPTDNFVDETIEISDPLTTKYTFSTDNLLDGKYIFHVQMLLKSALPGLCNLSGPTFNEDGTATYQGWLVNGTKGDTVTVYHEKSDVFGEQCPDDAVVALPAERVFQWQYLGSGTFNCYIDGVLKNNGETCSSPYTLNLKDKKNHTLTVVFNDVCKQSIVKKFVFGHWGCLQDKRGEPPSPPPPPPPPPEAPPADSGGLTNPFGSLGNISLTGNTSAARPAAPLATALWLSLALLAALAVLLQ